MRPQYSILLVLTAALVGCDLANPSGADDGPPATVAGAWTTGDVEVSADTAFALDGDPTYAAVEIDAVIHVRTDFDLTEMAGDVRGHVEDDLYATGEIRYRRHDGVIVRDPYTNDRLGGAGDQIEAVYVAPTLTVTSVGSYLLYSDFVDLALDFSDGTARMRRQFEVPVTLHRIGARVVRVVRSPETTFRRVEPA